MWRVGKPDAFLAAAVDTARAALVDIARPQDVGDHLAAKSEGERVVTHLFESRLDGYRGWQWFVTVARVARSKTATVSEIGLVPSPDAVLAPEWVPWSERVRPEDTEEAKAAAAEKPGDADAAAEAASASEDAAASEDGTASEAAAHDAGPAPSAASSPGTGEADAARAEAPEGDTRD
ncbi:hypothetical protein SCMU_08610 [Sinomonas cyclohexanicum]|uniref:DUF3027 domain-containing protein n=1 Tax=Sinomonas cyclohexanicum TaxID=322009 RepID=A0ABN6FEG8_SINCY|nr:hypothetical protein SCMU_08610 [Corynebacterium cyclohexanicum]